MITNYVTFEIINATKYIPLMGAIYDFENSKKNRPYSCSAFTAKNDPEIPYTRVLLRL